MDENQAKIVARAMGGDAWNSGGDVWRVVVRRADGGVVGVSEEVVCEYASEEELISGKPERSILLVAGANASSIAP